MFDIGWSELLIFVVVTLIFVGPKELPVMMRTVGRYVGILRRQAEEFRGHFDAAIEEAELDSVEAELNSVGQGVKKSVDDGVEKLNEDLSVQGVAPRVTSGDVAPEPVVQQAQDKPLNVAPTKADAS